ncbi:uncharacterized protein LOC133865397 [Alnus glutinosa]|uniref:uncharacterized protein LOC133865397 n=1 Tax=Alnus glutinosa TaxID=3517 RepID=UPI002D771267|nr:uncharacterized protein LOC133865397 [Alnus glutinosa]
MSNATCYIFITCYMLYSPLLLAFTEQDGNNWISSHVPTFSAIDPSYALPNNIAVITLQNLKMEKYFFDWLTCMRELLEKMELGSNLDNSKSTFTLVDEDHTLANALRFTLNQDPRVFFCGYSIPHPSENRVNIRVQTTGAPAQEVLKDTCQDLMMMMCQHVRSTFDKAVADYKMRNHEGCK